MCKRGVVKYHASDPEAQNFAELSETKRQSHADIQWKRNSESVSGAGVTQWPSAATITENITSGLKTWAAWVKWQRDLSVSHGSLNKPRPLSASLPWVLQMCDPQTLPLWRAYWTYRAQQRLAHSSGSCWPMSLHSAHSHYFHTVVSGWWGVAVHIPTGCHSLWHIYQANSVMIPSIWNNTRCYSSHKLWTELDIMN